MSAPPRTHKDNSVLQARVPGSPAWKERLHRRALRGVHQLRREHLSSARRGQGVTRDDLRRVIVHAMEVGDDGDDETLSGDLPPLSDADYEALMIALYEELRGELGPLDEASRFEEQQHLEEQAMHDAIAGYQDALQGVAPMDDGDDDSAVWGGDGDEVELVGCPACGIGLLADGVTGARRGCGCTHCAFAFVGVDVAAVVQAVAQGTAAHASVCPACELRWRSSGASLLEYHCQGCGRGAAKSMA